jgi:hypothetical protein
MADETENQVPNTPNQTESIHEAEVREQFHRTEAERARMATAAAQGAIPRGMVGDPRGAAGGAVGGVEETHQQIHRERKMEVSGQTRKGTGTG